MKNTCVYAEFEHLNQEPSSDIVPSYGSPLNYEFSNQGLCDDTRNYPYAHNKGSFLPFVKSIKALSKKESR